MVAGDYQLYNFMDMKTNDFEEYLEQVCFEANPTVLDDDMPDFFDEWLGNQNAEDFIRLGNAFCEERVRAERERIYAMLENMPAFTCCSDKCMSKVSDEAKKPMWGTNYLEREAVLQALTPTKTDKQTEV